MEGFPVECDIDFKLVKGGVDANAYLQAPGGTPSVTIPSFGVAFNNKGFAAYIPPPGVVGRRQVVAEITDNDLPSGTVSLGSFIATRHRPRPAVRAG